MNKKLNGWFWRIAIASAGVLITAGIYIATVKSNTNRIEKVEVKTHANEGDIRELKTDIKYIRKGVDEIKKSVIE